MRRAYRSSRAGLALQGFQLSRQAARLRLRFGLLIFESADLRIGKPV